MKWTTTLRLVTAAATLAGLGLSATATTSSPPPSSPVPIETGPVTASEPAQVDHRLTAEQQELVDWARARFGDAELELPDVDISFHPDIMTCNGRVGIYHVAADRIDMCRLDKKSLLHELAHVWANANLTDQERAAFTAMRGLDDWNDHSHDWADRGTEHAAEIVAWALMDRNVLVPAPVATAADQPTWRLVTIDDSDPDQLADAYRFLTGHNPAHRIGDDPRLDPPTESTSPEARGLLPPASG